MIEFKEGKYYSLDYKKAMKSFDVKRWPNFIHELVLFKKGPRKCISVDPTLRNIEGEYYFYYYLIFEDGCNPDSWGYTQSLISCFKEYGRVVQEEMDV